MSFILTLLIILAVLIIIIFLFVFYLVHKMKKELGDTAYNQLKNAIRNQDELRRESISREKSVIGMTKLVLPSIVEDYSDFSESMLYSKVENDLNDIFTAINNKKYITSEDLCLVQENVNDTIQDLINTNNQVSYTDVKFHRHALKSYSKFQGVSKIEVSSTVEYYYNDSRDKKNIDSDLKSQTRYTCDYVYIFDYKKVKGFKNSKLFSLSCPNCGGQLEDF